MSINALIFSNERNYRLSRHALFWFLWILYYAIYSAILMWKSYGLTKSFFEAFVEVAESTPLDMCFCYFIIYYLFPEFLHKGRYISMLILWWTASVTTTFLYELNSFFISSQIRLAFGMPEGKEVYKDFWGVHNLWALFSLFTQLNMEGCVAASIKLGKLRYINKQEIDLLKQEKEKIQPHEEQNLMQPVFLVDLLKRIEFLANDNPEAAVHSIKKIKNLLLYILYEVASPQVSLQKEISLLREYIDLEKLTAEKNITVYTSIGFFSDADTIAPSIILPFVENAFKQVYHYSLENLWIDINVQQHQNILAIKLSWGKPIDTSSLANGRNIILHNLSKRLKLIYPNSHHLKMMIEPEQIILDLNVDLKRAIN